MTADLEITDLESAAGWEPIEGISWRCNGGINPLILNYEQLAAIAGDELHEALRWALITVESRGDKTAAIGTPAMLLAEYRRCERRWHGPDYLPGICTVAQFIARHGGTDSRAKCTCLADLLRCFELCGSYNHFDADVAKAAFQTFHALAYCNANNPNNGRDAFQYDFAWEGSHAVYITARWHYPLRIMDADCRQWREMPRDEFNLRCQVLARKLRADESDATEDGWRLWWD
jgi:hypothetical protein